MTKKYHINRQTGRVNICKAEINVCPVGGEHFTDKNDAHRYKEKQLSDEYSDVLLSQSKIDNTKAKTSSTNDEITANFSDEIINTTGYPLSIPNINSEYKFRKFAEKVSTDNFHLKYVGGENAVFLDVQSNKMIKIPRASYERKDLRWIHETNKKFYEQNKDKKFSINENVYVLPKTDFVYTANNEPIIIQENLDEYNTGYIDYSDSYELNKIGFDDLKNENTKQNYKGEIILFDCFPK